eukprot:TRINITY_DN12182_c0_g1_i2.p1 TRINITY_DN12182_c0_g1~~TRINITY_DN12182_c0_g1_i2.p1  ORF type:complete len:141 (-),score=8.29 TRINITY_DN12182_c0_g1_i2:124-546(-)
MLYCTDSGNSARDPATGIPVFLIVISQSPCWAYGGYGVLLSVGLLDSIKRPVWEQCGNNNLCHGGDVRIANCILESTGVKLTSLESFGVEPYNVAVRKVGHKKTPVGQLPSTLWGSKPVVAVHPHQCKYFGKVVLGAAIG